MSRISLMRNILAGCTPQRTVTATQYCFVETLLLRYLFRFLEALFLLSRYREITTFSFRKENLKLNPATSNNTKSEKIISAAKEDMPLSN